MNDVNRTTLAKDALEQVAGTLALTLPRGLARGHVRVFARFIDGRLITPLRIAVVRIPGGALDGLQVHEQPADATLVHAELERQHKEAERKELLEGIVSRAGLTRGQVELVVEYTVDKSAGMHLHWVDASWFASEDGNLLERP